MNDKKEMNILNVLEVIRNSRVIRIILLGFLVLLLQIPIAMIRNVVTERQTTRNEAVMEVTAKWGKQQSIIGPMLTVPYVRRFQEKEANGKIKTRTELFYASFLPDSLQVRGKVDCEDRYRGIFKIPVFSAVIDIGGNFTRPDFSEWGIDEKDIVWDQAYLTLRISDVRAITNQVSLKWNKEKVHFLPGMGDFGGKSSGIHVPMKGLLSEKESRFSCQLNLNGSEGFFLAPFGKETTLELNSNWHDPSFQGNWLPSERSVSNEGFKAKWNIPFLGRNYPQKWKSDTSFEEAISAGLFGIKFISPVDHYRMSDRSIKYAILFLSLTFITLWLFEIIAGLRIHSIQYLLVGAGLCVFYLLELSLSEHIGFTIAYLLATLAVTVLIFGYCRYILGGYRRSIIMGIIILLLYSYLYVLLMNQDYALLIGSICLFILLAAVMYITRKIDWYSVKKPR